MLRVFLIQFTLAQLPQNSGDFCKNNTELTNGYEPFKLSQQPIKRVLLQCS